MYKIAIIGGALSFAGAAYLFVGIGSALLVLGFYCTVYGVVTYFCICDGSTRAKKSEPTRSCGCGYGVFTHPQERVGPRLRNPLSDGATDWPFDCTNEDHHGCDIRCEPYQHPTSEPSALSAPLREY
jgi:hypothetical protein